MEHWLFLVLETGEGAFRPLTRRTVGEHRGDGLDIVQTSARRVTNLLGKIGARKGRDRKRCRNCEDDGCRNNPTAPDRR